MARIGGALDGTEQDELLGPIHRQSADHHVVEQVEHGDVRANAERQRRERRDGKAWRSAEPANAVDGIRAQVVDESQPASLAACLLPSQWVAQLLYRLPGGIARRGTSSDEVFRPFHNVVLELGGHLALESGALEERSQKGLQPAPGLHTTGGTACGDLVMIVIGCRRSPRWARSIVPLS